MSNEKTPLGTTGPRLFQASSSVTGLESRRVIGWDERDESQQSLGFESANVRSRNSRQPTTKAPMISQLRYRKPALSDEAHPTLQLHINELVLNGFASQDRARIGAAVEAELADLLKALNLSGFVRTPNMVQMDAGTFVLPSPASLDALVKEIAAKIYLALRKGCES